MIKRRVEHLLGSFLMLTCIAASTGSFADTIGDVSQGQSFAQKICSSCHAVLADQFLSPVAEATPFQKVADTPGMTRTALTVFFRTPHKKMPNLIISGTEADDVIAYILGLKRSD